MRPAGLRPVLLALALAAASDGSPQAVAAPDPVRVDGTRWTLVSSGPREEAEEWVRVLDAAWPQYESFFGAAPELAPGERMQVRFTETADAMSAAIRSGGGSPPTDGGGYYCPVAKTSYAFRQPSAWYTRALLLHECAHQFHWRALGFGSSQPPWWYREGVVEHLAWHTWDGATLRLGASPLLTLEDYAGRALAAVSAPGFDLGDVLDGKAATERPVAMHLVRYLREGEGGRLRERFAAMESRMDRGTVVNARDFARTFGPEKTLVAGFRRWIESVQEPWASVWIEWDNRAGDALRGRSQVVGICRVKRDVRGVAATVRSSSRGPWRGGLLLSYVSQGDLTIGMVADGRTAQVHRLRAGRWEVLAEVACPAPDADGAWRVEASRNGESVRFVVNGTEVADTTLPPGALGLAVDHATVDFTRIDAR